MYFDKHPFIILRRFSIAWLFFAILLSIAVGQTKTSLNKSKVDIEIYGGQNGNLYTNGSNLITIISKDTTTIYSVKSSQGIVWQLDKYMFFVESLKKGKTTITIYTITTDKEIKVLQKDYAVIIPKAVLKYNTLPISPEISIGGFTKGKVKLDTLKNITSLSINDNYKILKATFYIGQTDLINYSIKSKYFDSQLKDIWKRIMPNCYITVDNIEFMDKNGSRYFYPNKISIIATE
jgi:hypothetical protein